MPAAPALSIENLGKRYLLGHETRPDTLRDTLAQGARGLLRRWLARRNAAAREEFWALREVSLEVAPGEVLGVVGRNGAGKSTLLKILSRITEPTTGRAVIRGRVASLLEVGTGFHPELTGRENIHLNGAILGMARAEIARKFDEIVAFAEVERFLDTPVKHYSSGMYVRLAFAVAAHLEPEILIVDEVLAVGDAAFQRKCLGKMQDVARHSGRTILFVSHNLAAVQSLCPRSVCLVAGRVAAQGPTADVLAHYRHGDSGRSAPSPTFPRGLEPGIRLRRLEFSPATPASGGAVEFILEIEADRPAAVTDLSLVLNSPEGQRVGLIDLRIAAPRPVAPGSPRRVRGRVGALPLVEGTYTVDLYFGTADQRLDIAEVQSLDVLPARAQPAVLPYAARHRGFVALQTDFLEDASLP